MFARKTLINVLLLIIFLLCYGYPQIDSVSESLFVAQDPDSSIFLDDSATDSFVFEPDSVTDSLTEDSTRERLTDSTTGPLPVHIENPPLTHKTSFFFTQFFKPISSIFSGFSKVSLPVSYSWVSGHFLPIAGGVIALALLFVIMLVLWLRPDAKRFLTTTRLSIMDKEVQKVCRYIEKNFSAPDLSVKKIAFDLITGESFIEALFEKELGITVSDFINQVRINRANIYFSHNNSYTKEKIAQMCGFETVEDFDEIFQKITSTSFEDYQIAARNG